MGLLVAQATRLCRPATRRTAPERQSEPMGRPFRNVARHTSGRRVADRGGRVAACRPRHPFSKHALTKSVLWRSDRACRPGVREELPTGLGEAKRALINGGSWKIRAVGNLDSSRGSARDDRLRRAISAVHSRRRVAVRSVESRLENSEQHSFPLNGCCFVKTGIPFDSLDQEQEPDSASGQSFRVGNAVAPQPLAQILCLPHVKHPLLPAAEVVNSGIGGNLVKEILAEPFDQRLRRWEQP